MAKVFDIKKDLPSFKITNISDKKAEILIYDFITNSADDWFGGIDPSGFADQIKEISNSVTDVDIRINSPGGDVFAGFTIYNLIRQMSRNGKKITVYIDGMAASIASIIALAGDEIIMNDPSEFMIHKPMGGMFGNSDELDELINRLDSIENQLVNVYRKKTGIDAEEIRRMLKAETYMTPTEALELGFVDTVIEASDTVRFAACAKSDEMAKKAPWLKGHNSLVRMDDKIKEKINNIIKRTESNLAR